MSGKSSWMRSGIMSEKVPGGQGWNGVKYVENPTCRCVEAKQSTACPRWSHASPVQDAGMWVCTRSRWEMLEKVIKVKLQTALPVRSELAPLT